MSRRIDSRTLALACTACVLTVASPLEAQALWLDRSDRPTIAFEWLKPNFWEASFFTSTSYLDWSVPLGAPFRLVGDIPLSHLASDDEFGTASQTSIGNPLLGVELPSGNWSGEFGVRIPLVSGENRDAAFVGGATDSDRLEAFIDDAIPVIAAVNYYTERRPGLIARVRLGAVVWLPTASGFETELSATYTGQVGYGTDVFTFLGGFTGRVIVSEPGDFGSRSLNQLGFSAIARVGRVRPGLHLRLPLDYDLKDVLDAVFGISVAVDLAR
jgi:hypothetical protein